ncbi:hypothetical protein FRC07_006345, partial [Ceratobasidium sp. 392]
MFYCPPSDKFFLSMQPRTRYTALAWQNFNIYSDVARLANRFCMVDIENWAAKQLRVLMQSSPTHISVGARSQIDDGIPRAFLLALKYAVAIQNISLEHDVRNLIQYNCTVPTYRLGPALLSFFHTPQLRQQDPNLFGFLFLTLLALGHSTWEQKGFTREDRVAFFSAQSYLTPLPESLGKDFTMPILVRPQYTGEGHLGVFEDK